LKNRFKMGQIKALWFWQRSCRACPVPCSGTIAEKDRSSGNRWYTVIAENAK
jgi:hypothetical protein